MANIQTDAAGRAAEDWRDDPSADERWNAGLDYGMTRLCAALGIEPASVTWDAATETLDGDVQAVIFNILRQKFGEDFDFNVVSAALTSGTDQEGSGAAEPHLGWLFLNPDSGVEWSASHPIESGEAPDAEDIRPATLGALRNELLSAWEGWAEARETVEKAALAAPPPPALPEAEGSGLEKLRALSEAAPKGPWIVRGDEVGEGPNRRPVAFLESADGLIIAVDEDPEDWGGSPALEFAAALETTFRANRLTAAPARGDGDTQASPTVVRAIMALITQLRRYAPCPTVETSRVLRWGEEAYAMLATARPEPETAGGERERVERIIRKALDDIFRRRDIVGIRCPSAPGLIADAILADRPQGRADTDTLELSLAHARLDGAGVPRKFCDNALTLAGRIALLQERRTTPSPNPGQPGAHGEERT